MNYFDEDDLWGDAASDASSDSDASLWGEQPSVNFALDPPGLFYCPPGVVAPTLLDELEDELISCYFQQYEDLRNERHKETFELKPDSAPVDEDDFEFGAPQPGGHLEHTNNTCMLFEGDKKIPYHLRYVISTTLPKLARVCLPRKVWREWVADKDAKRCIILNAYEPGQGIAPHVDLESRFQEVVMGLSLRSAANMTFLQRPRRERRIEERDAYEQEIKVTLGAGSVYFLTEEARYDWKHGIEDVLVEEDLERGHSRTRKRKLRFSITVRKLKPGADVVGHSQSQAGACGTRTSGSNSSATLSSDSN